TVYVETNTGDKRKNCDGDHCFHYCHPSHRPKKSHHDEMVTTPLAPKFTVVVANPATKVVVPVVFAVPVNGEKTTSVTPVMVRLLGNGYCTSWAVVRAA